MYSITAFDPVAGSISVVTYAMERKDTNTITLLRMLIDTARSDHSFSPKIFRGIA
jgi:hypothetical protein